ncbi:PREDICTED: juvenile hormone epoxide hydrolase 1-like [Rhagoletis zephyria]|uniref:juvenile hormone epoxide hydrolase 1-like n=1 Tax=Rhagoletis zephyria TaxID=28612 RepID=UPI0008116F13|nr:PREDICTED: juvenile hormone epoxide hydrolase 1-like [Rhagoletis zephyria]
MGVFIRFAVVTVSFLLAVLLQNYRLLSRSLPAPKLNDTEYWGPGNGVNYQEDSAVKTFDIKVKPELIAGLKTQLSRPLNLHAPLEGIGFQYGFNTKELQNIVTYWLETYLRNWDKREAYLSQFPHFETQIQGLRIHYIHVKPQIAEGKTVLPLLLLHGWPGSVREFYDIIPLLTSPNEESEYIFEVIAPSLPGFGWSQGASKIGFGPAQIAVVLRNLMQRIGLDRFLVQGGDWGSVIGSNMAALFPQNVLAYHSNWCISLSPLALVTKTLCALFPRLYLDSEQREFFRSFSDEKSYLLEETGYVHLQATKPDTIGTVLSYNPIGLAAYILEKFSTWTNPEYRKLSDGGLTKNYTLDSLLDNVMIYYITNSITTSQRIYAEAFSKTQTDLDRVHIQIPTACARFKWDLTHATDAELKHKYKNLTQSTFYKDGGHFPALEVPQTLFKDFIEFVKKVAL